MARPRKRTDDELLEAAREVFLAHGPGASLQRVADRVGLSQPAILKRFGTKEAFLLRALLPTEHLGWAESLGDGPDDRPMPEQLRAICRGGMAFFATAIPRMLTLRASGRLLPALGGEHDPAMQARTALVAFLSRARELGRIRSADPERLATLLIGSLQARALVAHVRSEPLDGAEQEAHAAAVVDMVWNGIRPATAEGGDGT